MALFSKKEIQKKSEKKAAKSGNKVPVATKAVVVEDSAKGVTAVMSQGTHPALVIKAPRVTEKAGLLSEKGVYVFTVAANASKPEISKAMKSLYGVTPEKIRIVKVPKKRILVRNKVGFKKGSKKAYVYLPKNKTIEVI